MGFATARLYPSAHLSWCGPGWERGSGTDSNGARAADARDARLQRRAAIADFNNTHATNPAWTPHARFHVVWQVSSYHAIALVGLGLIWIAGGFATMRLYLAALLAGAVYLGFFAGAFLMPVYGGRLTDPNGYPPIKVLELGGRKIPLDANTTVFSVMVTILILGVIAI